MNETEGRAPRMIEVKLSRESPGLIVLQGITRSDQSIAFFVEQWAALRNAVDRDIVTGPPQAPGER